MKKTLIYFLLPALMILAAGRLYYFLTDDFRMDNISDTYEPRTHWEIPPLLPNEKSNLDAILQQKFFYIGKGVQSYAFSSEDGNYVIKFFKFKHLKSSPLLNWLPEWAPFEKYKLKKKSKAQFKFDGVFEGYHLAYMEHKDQSGLIFLHINPTLEAYPILTVYDKIGRTHLIPLDRVPFLIQIKAKTMRTVLHDLLVKGEVELAKARITQIFQLYLSEYHKSLYDHDHGIMHNAGFAGESPIHLDVGKLKKDENMRNIANYSQDIILVAKRMAKWLKAKEPKDYPALAQHIESEIGKITQKPFNLDIQ